MVALAAAAPSVYLVNVSGDADVRFTLECESGGERHHYEGAPPHIWRTGGPGISCTLRQTAGAGQVRVRVEGPTGNRTMAATSGQNSVVRMRMGGSGNQR